MSKILITGASGRIGRELVKNAGLLFDRRTEVHLLLHSSPYVDFNSSRFSAVTHLSNRYDFSIHLAAIADTSYTERPENREQAKRVNVELTKRVCDVSERTVLVSTDHVTGHTNSESMESDSPNPCSFYGETKAEAEKVTLDSGGAVIRIQSMLGAENRIIRSVLESIAGKPYTPFSIDDYIRPSYFSDFLKMIEAIHKNPESGIYHLSCEGEVLSRHALAQLFLGDWIGRDLPTKITSLAHEKRKNGPRRLVLNTAETRRKLGLGFTDSRLAIIKHLDWAVN